jgi:hypothetical protein
MIYPEPQNIHNTVVAKLNDEETKLFYRCIEIANVISLIHQLPFRKIIPVDIEAWGRCNADGILEIAFYKFLDGNERWSINRSEVLRTLGHELAHLRHHHHGPSFWPFCNQLIGEIAVMEGIRIKPEANVYRK